MSQNTWEPEEKLDRSKMIEEYEKTHKERAEAKKSSTSTSDKEPSEMNGSDDLVPIAKKVKVEEKTEPRGFDRGLKPERIIGATDATGKLMFLIKWEGSDEADIVDSAIANVRCPQIVIRFYEERLTWHTGKDVDHKPPKKKA